MDKEWMRAPRFSSEYDKGLTEFIELAFATSAEQNRILCPCKKCGNNYWLDAQDIRDHLIGDGLMDGYTSWIHHGEGMWSSLPGVASSSDCEEGTIVGDNRDQMLMEGFGMYDTGCLEANEECGDELDVDAEAYYKLVNDGSQELYPGCQKFSKLQFLVRLLNIKNLWRVSNGCFDELLSLIKDALPNGDALPKNFHEAKKFVKAIGVGYECIDACKNDCILFRKEHANATFCLVCKSSRWKYVKRGLEGKHVHKVPAKVVRHFPLKKRLQRLFMSSKTAEDMIWHTKRTKDGLLRHPADSPAWKYFDGTHKKFSSELRNVRLGLAADGFNPFGNMNLSYSIWPIILIPYNLPPWICMKQSNFILSVLVPGKKEAGKDIDVYMQLVIDDLELWTSGVMTYDASRSEKFHLHAALLWTISDWLGRGILSGESIAICSHCLTDTCSLRLKHGHKTCYMGHRRFLAADHKFRFQAKSFDGTQDFREPPTQLSGHAISEMTKDIKTVFGKLQKEKKRDDSKVFKKQSCFFQLPYWETLLLRHNIDPMHVEYNVFDNTVNTLLGVDNKSKDNLNARLDLQEMGIRPDQHPYTVGDKVHIPSALYTMSSTEKKMFCQFLKETRFPAGYSSNLDRQVDVDGKRLIGCKSHDCHTIMQDLMPLGISNILPESVCTPLIRLSNYFKKIFSKVIRVSEIEKLEAEIPEILCQLEKIFPPSYFTMMVHLIVHLATEVRLGGPVHYRSMYPVERYLCKLKSMVRTRSHPEGAIAEGYQFGENLALILALEQSLLPYLRIVGRPLSGTSACELGITQWIQAHRYVLFNYPHIAPYVEKHIHSLNVDNNRNKRYVERTHHNTFHTWFSDHVQRLIARGNEVPTEVKLLAQKPYMMTRKYNSYSINGYTFHIRSYAKGKATQCDAVALVAKTSSFSSSKDSNPVIGDVAYYGRITEIIELNYSNIGHVVLFNCEWVDSVHQGRGVQKGKFGRTQVNFKHLLISKRQNIVNGCASRIPKDQWVWLVNHWKSSNAQHKSEKNKAIREQQLNASHTTGSRSYAVVLDQMELKEGRDIGRSELYVATHTKKNGKPVDDFSGEKIEENKKRFEEDPSLIFEEAHDKDLYSTIFPKERSGRRHGLGLLVGGVASARVFEALADVQEVRHENKRLWSVVEKLMSNQTKLQHSNMMNSKVRFQLHKGAHLLKVVPELMCHQKAIRKLPIKKTKMIQFQVQNKRNQRVLYCQL